MKILALFLVLISISSVTFAKKNLSSKSLMTEGSYSSNEASSELVAHSATSNKGFVLQSTAVIFIYYFLGIQISQNCR
jgi:hypothetical protein